MDRRFWLAISILVCFVALASFGWFRAERLRQAADADAQAARSAAEEFANSLKTAERERFNAETRESAIAAKLTEAEARARQAEQALVSAEDASRKSAEIAVDASRRLRDASRVNATLQQMIDRCFSVEVLSQLRLELSAAYSRHLEATKPDLVPAEGESLRQEFQRAVSGALAHSDLGSVLERLVLRTTLEEVNKSLEDQPLAQAEMLSMLGARFQAFNRVDLAESLNRRALEIRRRNLGDDHPDTIDSMVRTAGVVARGRQFDAAEALFREGLDRNLRARGAADPQTIEIGGAFARFLEGQSERRPEAEALLRRNSDSLRAAFGNSDPRSLSAADDLATFLEKYELHRAESEQLCREIVEVRRRVNGENASETLAAKSRLAKGLGARNRHKEAAQIWREVYFSRRDTIGTEHRDTLSALRGFGGESEASGSLEDAEEAYRFLYMAERMSLRDDGVRRSATGLVLARVLKRRGKLPESEVVLRQVVAEYTRNNEPMRHIIDAKSQLAHVLQSQHKFDQAEPLWRELIVYYEGQVQPRAADIALCRLMLGIAITGLGRFGDARDELIAATAAFDRIDGSRPWRRSECRRALVALYRAWNDAEPGRGFDEEAGFWQAQLDAIDLPSGTKPSVSPMRVP